MDNGTRILLVNYMLERLTGGEEYLSSYNIIEKLRLLGTEVVPKTIHADIKSIEKFNHLIEKYSENILATSDFDISGSIALNSVRKKGTQVERTVFDTSELVILFKFIENSFYLSQDEKRRIMQKLLLHTSLSEINKFRLNHGFDKTTHYNKGNKTLVVVGIIQKAISLDKCLKFKYYTFKPCNGTFERIVLDRTYHIYPIRFVMEGNYLYVIGYDLQNLISYKKSEEYLQVKNYRIDRITQLQTVEKNYLIHDFLSENIVMQDKLQINNNINGFGGKEYITLKIKVFSTGEIEKTPFKVFIDRFGHDISKIEMQEQNIILTIKNVLYGVGLFHYLFSFNNQIVVLEPIKVKNQMMEKIDQMSNYYKNI